jgi:peptidyl-dipeptidase Dcp
MENWCYEPEALALSQLTTKPGMSNGICKKSKKALVSRRISNHASVEFWIIRHGMARSRSNSNYRCKALKPNNLQQLYPEVAENAMSTAFSHIFKEDIHQDIVTNGPKF